MIRSSPLRWTHEDPESFGPDPHVTIEIAGIDDVYRFANHLLFGQVEFGRLGRKLIAGLRRKVGAAYWKKLMSRYHGGGGFTADATGPLPGDNWAALADELDAQATAAEDVDQQFATLLTDAADRLRLGADAIVAVNRLIDVGDELDGSVNARHAWARAVAATRRTIPSEDG